MKYLLLLTIGFISLSTVTAQNVIDKHFDYLLEVEDATHINVTGKMFEMINSINVEVESEDKEVIEEMQEFLGSIRSFELVAAKPTTARRNFDKANTQLRSDYDELLSVKDKEGSFMLYIDEHNGTVHEVVGIGTDNEQLLVFSVLGSMKLEQVGKVAEHIQDAGMDQLSKVKDYNIGEVKVFPNPVSASGSFNLETSAAFVGGVATLYNAQGTVVKTYKITDTSGAYEIDDIPSGNYVLQLVKDEVSIKKKILVVN